MRPVGLVVLCLLLATCGGESAPAPPPLSREAALDLLLSPAGPDERAPALIGGLTAEDPVVACACREGLVAMGREAAPYLIHAIRSAWLERNVDSSVAIQYSGGRHTLVVQAAKVLSEACMYGAFSAREVVHYLLDEDYSEEKLLSLLRIESVPHPEEYVDSLADLMGARVDDHSGEAAVPVDPPAQAEVPALIQALDDEERWVRLKAIESLGRAGPDARPAQAKLLAILAGDDGEARCFAATALAEVGADPEQAVPVLRRAVLDHGEDLYLVMEALRALATLRSDSGDDARLDPR